MSSQQSSTSVFVSFQAIVRVLPSTRCSVWLRVIHSHIHKFASTVHRVGEFFVNEKVPSFGPVWSGDQGVSG